MQDKLRELKTRLQETYDLQMATSLLSWDQSTYMPEGGADARARQISLLARLYHEKFTDEAIGRLLDDLRPYEESLRYDSDDASLIRVTRREYERAIKVPPEFMARLYSHSTHSFQAWTVARPQNNFASMVPILEETLDLSRQLAGYFPGYEHIADPLIGYVDFGMRASVIRTIFAELRTQLVPLVEAITSLPKIDDSCLHRHYPETQQIAFGEDVVRQMGYDFKRGRLDKTHHPFQTKFSLGDVRITTRVKENSLAESLFSIVHEAGHAMYEQGINLEYEGTPLAIGASAGLHESQSRLWENIIGRSREFWEFFYPKLQDVFPEQLRATSLEEFYRAINTVERSLIRTEADEVTYNLHVMLRFDFELALLEGSLAIRDLPEAWRDRYRNDLGITPPDDRDGVLQDVHWFAGWIGGAFQGYTLGNILGAQIYAQALKSHPDLPQQISRGNFQTLHGWLIDNLYQHGAKFTTSELVERVTGGPIQITPYITYLQSKYGELYDV